MRTPLEPKLRKILAQITGTQEALLPVTIELTLEQKNKFEVAKQKYLQGVPLDYILERVEIAGLQWRIEPGILIPRPETEQWVSDFLRQNKLWPNSVILDLGTGSGFIGLKVLSESKCRVILSDISQQALNCAMENSQINGLDNNRLSFIHSDLLENHKLVESLGQDWILLANLPYLPNSDRSLKASNNLTYEPDLALFSGEFGLDLFIRLIDQLDDKALFPQLAYFELDPRNIEQAKTIAQHVFKNIEILLDFNQIPRVLKCSP
jgi:release factor glutamine methyltransferase